MFSGKDLKIKLVYMGVGGMIAIIGMLFGIGMLSPVTAQRDKFDTIQCRSLEIVDEDDNVSVILTNNEHGGTVGVVSKDGRKKAGFIMTTDSGGIAIYKDDKEMVSLSIAEYGGNVSVHGKDDGLSAVGIGVDEHGGRVSAYGKDEKSGARLSITEHGGRVSVGGKGRGQVVMSINEYGNGGVSTWDNNGYRQ